MLQIITGKFFRDVPLYETLHRGVFYSNYHLHRGETVSTAIGSLLPSTSFGGMSTLTYEIVERLEAVARNGSRSVMISTGGDEIVNDFAAVISFALNITCTTDPDLTRRLTADKHPALGTGAVPRRYLHRMFDAQLHSAEDDSERLRAFIDHLVSLDRTKFETGMRSIRQYVTAAHRLSDNPDLAYTLFVAAVESLAQDFNAIRPTWPDYDEQKRARIDTALDGVDEVARERVRNAILEIEHVDTSIYRPFSLNEQR